MRRSGLVPLFITGVLALLSLGPVGVSPDVGGATAREGYAGSTMSQRDILFLVPPKEIVAR